MALLNDRIAEAVKLLDSKIPGWYAHINLEQFDMMDNEQCVLGQLFKDQGKVPFITGVQHLSHLDVVFGEETDKFVVDNAFEDDLNADYDYEEMTQEWKKVIFDRQKNMG